jgi:hypothetical protein
MTFSAGIFGALLGLLSLVGVAGLLVLAAALIGMVVRWALILVV